MTRPLVPLALLFCTLAGCMRPPANLAGKFEPIMVPDVQQTPREGVAVRWGGRLVSTSPGKDQTCFEIASAPLDGRARPKATDETFGRFLACAPGFYEPSVYTPGREVTVVGALAGTTTGKVGQYEYTYPRVDATTVHLWPERRAEPAGPVFFPSVGISIGGVF